MKMLTIYAEGDIVIEEQNIKFCDKYKLDK